MILFIVPYTTNILIVRYKNLKKGYKFNMNSKTNKKKEDLRMIKTKEIIRNTFESMILEMDYDYITIKELTKRAKINRKTFYYHYKSLDDLLLEIQKGIYNPFIEKEISYENLEDIKYLIRLFFEIMHNNPINERIICSENYKYINDKIVKKIINYRKKNDGGAFSDNKAYENIIFSFYGASSSIIYRQWVADGKKLSLEEIKELAVKLVCHGLESIMKK
ncbi:TetR/AcrR family transcriptional regulator [Brachyspira catarrhinii]|uniref:TetR/AcrR family transcriptional regulator n=2 Tax=Brachyspira catarrhinii TaxID=2528966 RepID=A0ABY2TSP4_9SPIR|nr:TetR/AcrR family transcriptional regulator [Brachyspira catarrhinii]